MKDGADALAGGRYRLVALAGRGGVAAGWRAELVGSESFRRPVAVKRILGRLVNAVDHRAMFVSEAQLTARLDHPNVVQVYDFGEGDVARNRVGKGALTPAGVVKGELAYMAPEVLQGTSASPRSDVYSCGVVLWELLCGRRLFGEMKDMAS